MSDLISREEILKLQYEIADSATLSARNVINAEDVEDLPSAEPQIIRCGNCKHHDGIRCYRWNSTIETQSDDYCSNAERREEE